MSEPLLQIHNRHVVACGDPPIVNSDDPHVYIGYFQNAFGEQWIFTSNSKTGAKRRFAAGISVGTTCSRSKTGMSRDCFLAPRNRRGCRPVGMQRTDAS